MHRILMVGVFVTALGAGAVPVARAADGAMPKVTIGVLAPRGEARAMTRWWPTAEYLNNEVPDHEFVIRPATLEELPGAIERREVDFVLTNPGNYVVLEAEHGITRIVTLTNLRGGKPLRRFGAVILTRADRDDIKRLADLRGKSFMAVGRNAFGGFQMAWRELSDAGIDPFSEFSRLEFAGFPQDDIVMAVRRGLVDAGTVRTDILERMIKEGQIDAGELRVLAERITPGFEFAHSTRLYPEWPFARAVHTPDELAQEVAVALMTMSPYDPAALSGNYAGWTVPLDYNTVHELFRDLRLGQYSGQIHFGDFVREYRHWVASGIALFAVMVLIIAYVTNLNYRLKSSTARLQQEIGERRRTEAELTKLSSVVEHTADIVMITDPVGIIEYVNPAFEEVTGYSREEVVGKPSRITKSGKHDKRFYDKLWRSLPAGEVYRDLFVNRRKDGSLFYEEKTITPLKDEHGKIGHLICTGKDVTERIDSEDLSRKHQEQLAHVSRVGMMGEMASSIAHEVNQPLAAIANYARGCVLRLQSKDFNVSQIIVALENIIAQSDRSAEIIRRMRNFVRKGEPKRSRVDVAKIVKDAAGLAYIEARKKGITLRLELGDAVPHVNADVIQIEQVILNLIRNAIEAMGNNRWNDREMVIQTRAGEGGQVEVAVRDSGHGLVGTGGDLMYNAFYTTKPGGMGMGLSISRSIVEAHGGSLNASNNPGKGATFRFTLPCTDDEAARDEGKDAAVTERHLRNAS